MKQNRKNVQSLSRLNFYFSIKHFIISDSTRRRRDSEVRDSGQNRRKLQHLRLRAHRRGNPAGINNQIT